MMTKLFSGLALAVCLLTVWLPVPAGGSGEWLVVSNTDLNTRQALNLDGVEKLTLRFFHSYDRQWVEESFLVADGYFCPAEVVYSSDTYDYRSERYTGTVRVQRNRIQISNIKPRPSDIRATIVTRIAFTEPQRLLLKRPGRVTAYLFTEWGEPGQQLTLTIQGADADGPNIPDEK